MGRRVVITGSAGFLGRAMRAAFEAQGDEVVGVDRYRHGENPVLNPNSIRYEDGDWGTDLECQAPDIYAFDVLIANAKVREWEGHYRLGARARQSIINISSIYGILGNDPSMYEGTEVEPTPASYAAAKGAMVALTRWQATNLAPVRANCVCPGGIYRGHLDTFHERYSARVPLGRMGTEADIVPLVVFLADPIRAAYINGAIIPVDGGLHAMA